MKRILSDVAKGGGTSFVQGGMKATPEKGSAVFWYNMLKNGAVNDFTWHGACPVLFGEKWGKTLGHIDRFPRRLPSGAQK
ncbi:unnamed protein product [Allacma fusca]|uniref:Prolyl 4-hydroxylase alpha subunit Fe(2+) 2OG dioxygenase domain-containing protein n=1 Tax=Allacma fusca TaxID=39272 RepID=A0A8J2PJB0_9HEXA|nr:unnamed protein product [Allacma fusca]